VLLVDLVAMQVFAETGTALLVLREHDAPHRLLPISIGGETANSIAIAASGQPSPRPLTHDLMASLVESFEGHLDAVEVTDLQNGTYFANLALSGPIGERRIDTRPSDAIALAVRLGAPLYVSEHVLDEAGALPEPEIDEDAIDAEVDEFRHFLDELDPSDFLPDE
jgi:bifunctional DNase/RNase